LAGYLTSKGAIQFPYGEDLPEQLIRDIAQFRAQEAEERAATKKKKKLK
jgi:uncharacterized protein YdhG (YjbR/CyaY superfamily)